MRSALVLLLASTAFGQGLDVPEIVQVETKTVTTVVVVPETIVIRYKPRTWLLIDPVDPNATLSISQSVTDTGDVWEWEFMGPAGKYRIRQLDPENFQITEASCTIFTGDPPDPGPDPDPDPGPGPALPKGVVILHETASGGVNNNAVNPAVRRALENGYPNKWRLYDPDLTDQTLRFEDPEMVKLFRYAAKQGTVPWLVISTGSRVISQGLPPSSDELLGLLGVSVSSSNMECRYDSNGNRYCTPKQGAN